MNAKTMKLYMCADCDALYVSESAAQMCCPRCECGEKVKRGHTRCETCLIKINIERTKARLDAAEVVTENDLPDSYMLFDENDFYDSIESYCEQFEGDGSPDEWLFVAGRVQAFVDADDIAQRVEEDMHEDAEFPADAIGILRVACDKVNEILHAKNFCHFEPKYKQKISVRDAWAEAFVDNSEVEA